MLSIRAKTLLLLCPALFISASGCHTIGLSEHYGDCIDRVADQQLSLDNSYRPGLDLTRLRRAFIHQEAMVNNIGFYPNNNYPNAVPVEQAVPPSEVQEPTQRYEHAPPPPVPAAKLPVIDIDSLHDISQWKPKTKEEAQSDQKTELVSAEMQQSAALRKSTSAPNSPLMEVVAPVDSIEARPMPPVGPVSAPASIPPSQRFYNAKQTQ